MVTHLLALLGLTLLCGGWVLLQRWVVRQEPARGQGFRAGCGACSNGECSRRTGAAGE